VAQLEGTEQRLDRAACTLIITGSVDPTKEGGRALDTGHDRGRTGDEKP
jgi:hypothetical protein